METKIEDKMVGGEGEDSKPRILTYYEKDGLGVEGILRCAGCLKLIVTSAVGVKGCCPKCGHKRFTEVRTLSIWEQFLLRVGLINFKDKDKFLKEFSRG